MSLRAFGEIVRFVLKWKVWSGIADVDIATCYRKRASRESRKASWSRASVLPMPGEHMGEQHCCERPDRSPGWNAAKQDAKA